MLNLHYLIFLYLFSIIWSVEWLSNCYNDWNSGGGEKRTNPLIQFIWRLQRWISTESNVYLRKYLHGYFEAAMFLDLTSTKALIPSGILLGSLRLFWLHVSTSARSHLTIHWIHFEAVAIVGHFDQNCAILDHCGCWNGYSDAGVECQRKLWSDSLVLSVRFFPPKWIGVAVGSAALPYFVYYYYFWPNLAQLKLLFL